MTLKIKKGNHYSYSYFFRRLFSFFNTSRCFDFELYKNCWFEKIEEDDYDVNKLLGYSYGYHHHNSIRLGWVPAHKENEFELYLYRYEKGVRQINYLMNIGSNESYNVFFDEDFKKNRLVVSIKKSNDKSSTQFLLRNFSHQYPKIRFGYSLWFYFGGNKTAPRNMACSIIKIF